MFFSILDKHSFSFSGSAFCWTFPQAGQDLPLSAGSWFCKPVVSSLIKIILSSKPSIFGNSFFAFSFNQEYIFRYSSFSVLKTDWTDASSFETLSSVSPSLKGNSFWKFVDNHFSNSLIASLYFFILSSSCLINSLTEEESLYFNCSNFSNFFVCS